jgi:putative transposase
MVYGLMQISIREQSAMPAKKYHVELTDQERTTLEQMLRRGKHSTRRLTRARILLKVDFGLRDEDIAQELDTSIPTVERTRRRFSEVRLASLNERPRPGRKRLLEQKGEARLIAEACSTAPEGRERWTLQLLADRVIELKLVDSCSADTVRRILKKTRSSPGFISNGASGKSTARLWQRWKMFWTCMPSPMMRSGQKLTSMKQAAS